MRYNTELLEYDKYIQKIAEEDKQKEIYYKKIKLVQDKLDKLEKDLSSKKLCLQKNQVLKNLVYLNKDINKYAKEIEYCKARKLFFEQKLCNHDFGIVINSSVNHEDKTCYSGICLECGAELNDIEEKIFVHPIYITDEIKGTMNINDYKNKLVELKDVYGYVESNYDDEIGEKIVNELYNDAKSLKKKFSRLK